MFRTSLDLIADADALFALTKAIPVKKFLISQKNKHDRKEIIKSHLTSSCLEWTFWWMKCHVSQQEIIWFAISRDVKKLYWLKKRQQRIHSLINSKLIRVIKYKIKKFSFWFFLFILDNHIPDMFMNDDFA